MKRMKVAYALAILVAVGFIFWITTGFQAERTCLNSEKLTALQMQSEAEEGGLLVQTAQLGRAFQEAQELAFHTEHRCVRVLLDDVCIYEFGFAEGAPEFVDSRGSLWHVVPLPADSTGSELTIELYAAYRNLDAATVEVSYGATGDVKFALLRGMLPTLLCNSVVIALGVAAVLLHVALRLQKGAPNHGLIYVGLMAITVACWVLCQKGVLQLLFPNALTGYFFDFFTLFLFPIPFNAYLYTLCIGEKRKLALAECWVYVGCLCLNVFCQRLGIADMYTLLPVTHTAMLLNLGVAGYLIWHEIARCHNRDMRVFCVPLMLAMLCAMLELISFYRVDAFQTSYFLQVGVILYLCALIVIAVSHYFRDVTESQKQDYYDMLVNVDMLTGAGNRNAYESVLNDPERSAQILGVLTFDINGLRIINETHGHDMGNQAIRRCCESIREAFRGMGDCYRIGDDEFAFLARRTEDLGRCIRTFEALMRDAEKTLQFPVQVALGWALCDPQQPDALREAIRRSNESMDADKIRKKNA